MNTITTIKELRSTILTWKQKGLTIGLVPTMGFLHEGHTSLIERASRENDRVIVSVFVNPTQFGPSEDLSTYPRDLFHDQELCENAGATILFHPSVEEMYPEHFSTHIITEGPASLLCGKSRPHHFQGVCTVVAKLFLITTPTRAYFGEKDAQQLAVIKRMSEDLHFDIEIIGCPIIREEDGLAKSSRNTYLNNRERKAALILHQALSMGKEMILCGVADTEYIRTKIEEFIQKEPLARIDYVELVSFPDITPTTEIQGTILCALAVYIGKTRLIDNFILDSKECHSKLLRLQGGESA